MGHPKVGIYFASMESHKFAIKFFTQSASAPQPREFVPVFHHWIQQHLIPNHLLIDVADYSHVPQGPGTVLVSHEAIFSIDQEGGRPGLHYFRRQPFADAPSFEQRLRTAFRATLGACALLESDAAFSGRLKFRTDEILFRIHDRLLAPNTPEMFAQIKPQLQELANTLLAAPVTLEHRGKGDELMEVIIRSAGSPSVSDLASRLG